jgi:aminopeptidase N
MLRRRMGDALFLKMLAELRRRFESRPLSTTGLRELVKEYLPPRLSPSKVDAFFDNWVYSSGIPTFKLRYTVKGVPPAVKLSGQVEQSGVDDDFSAETPVVIQFAKGASQTIWVETSSSVATFSATLKQVPSKVSIPAGTGVLALKK